MVEARKLFFSIAGY